MASAGLVAACLPERLAGDLRPCGESRRQRRRRRQPHYYVYCILLLYICVVLQPSVRRFKTASVLFVVFVVVPPLPGLGSLVSAGSKKNPLLLTRFTSTSRNWFIGLSKKAKALSALSSRLNSYDTSISYVPTT